MNIRLLIIAILMFILTFAGFFWWVGFTWRKWYYDDSKYNYWLELCMFISIVIGVPLFIGSILLGIYAIYGKLI